MAYDVLDSLLKELGGLLGMDDLRSDDSGSCLIQLQNGVLVQFELFEKSEEFLICAQIGKIPPGSYRERLFAEALKANNLPHPNYGTFAYSDQVDQLVLFGLLPLKGLTGEKVFDYLKPFVAKAKEWLDAIEKNDVPSLSVETSSKPSTGGLFGLTP